MYKNTILLEGVILKINYLIAKFHSQNLVHLDDIKSNLKLLINLSNKILAYKDWKNNLVDFICWIYLNTELWKLTKSTLHYLSISNKYYRVILSKIQW